MSEIYQNKTPEQIRQIINNKLVIYRMWDPNFRVVEAHIELQGDRPRQPASVEYTAIMHYIRSQNRNPDNFKIDRYIGISSGVEIYHFLNLIEIS